MGLCLRAHRVQQGGAEPQVPLKLRAAVLEEPPCRGGAVAAAGAAAGAAADSLGNAHLEGENEERRHIPERIWVARIRQERCGL